MRALAFDTGGTVLDWHGTLVDALRAIDDWRGSTLDPHAFANDWRRRTLAGIAGQRHPSFDMDDVHLRTLDETIAAHRLPRLPEPQRLDLWRVWHRLRAWPDFVPALARIRSRFPVASFTLLPVPLVIDVSRLNDIRWDAIVSCQMIGIYKPHPEAYVTAARWLGCAPANVTMVACHNFDLSAARAVGMRTAFVRRPAEWGPAGSPDPEPKQPYDHVVDDFAQLADRVLAAD